ncbi:hypothetical protein ABIB25_005931, partial [Nakamurella sp. UYEF19]|uniref:DUF6262 family protein n=1 Tax=Nakamurella sp. UYEF19 TaxID=1756392 RepID=UPI0033994EF1
GHAGWSYNWQNGGPMPLAENRRRWSLHDGRRQQAAQRKSDDATAKAQRALIALHTKGRPINFNTVAAEASVSKDFLYANSDIRRQIIQHRKTAAPESRRPATTPSGRSDASSVVKLAVASTALRRLRTENEILRSENARLLGDLTALRRG